MTENEPKKQSVAEREEEALTFWEAHGIFKKSLEKRAPKGEFVFYDGPPFATGLPHFGSLLPSAIKDVIPRFKTMQGFRVPRRWGWDCHGLPVENEVEKELGFKTKKDIEQYGIAKFNVKAREIVMRYVDDWRKYIARMGRWVDMNDDYRTMDSSYTESVWWAFKTLYDKGLIYEGFKSMQLCPRCETTLSNFEVTQGYKEITDSSAFVKFALVGAANTYLIAWTTTPWTLPGNVALAVNPAASYAFVEITASNAPEIQMGDTYIIGAKEDILKRIFGQEQFVFDMAQKVGSFIWKGNAVSFSAKKGVKGRELIGQSYAPLFDYYSDSTRFNPPAGGLNLERGWRVYGGAFVTETNGTGIVHIAPAFGEDDYQLAVKEKLPFIQHIATDGAFKKEVLDFAGLQAKPKGNPRETDEKIAALLAKRGQLLRTEPYTHDYAHCWRCETPLLNFAAPSWFVKVSEMREKLVALNKKIQWIPKEVGEFRFGNWLAEAKDWAISRSRFWGAPIPIWRCERCRGVQAVGSLEEVRKGSSERLTALTLLRHGESEKNIQKMYDNSPTAYPLTGLGERQAEVAAKKIKEAGGIDAIYTSPVRRARETAEIVAARLGKEVIVDEDLREVDSGEWDGKCEDDPAIAEARAARNTLPLEAYYRYKRGGSGENWEEVESRMKRALARILAKHRGERVLIVSHEGPIVYALKSIDNLTFEETDKFYKKNLIGGYAEPKTLYLDAQTGTEFDLHRPTIDEVMLDCAHCAKTTGTGRGLMRRVPEVFDCWFESGAMPFAQAHYPFEPASSAGKQSGFQPNSGWFRKAQGFPAQFIAEGLDQTRGWFYSLLVLGATLFDRSPYRAVIVNGLILAENGAKMSKRLKNYPDPLEVAAKYGADALRYYLLSSPVVRGEEVRFSERGVDEVAKKIFNRLDNVLQFYILYAKNEKRKTQSSKLQFKSQNVLDRWILARLNQLITEVTEALERYEIDKAARPLGDFVDDLSTWYLRRSRERIKGEALEDKEAALASFGFVLLELSKVLAPFAPFFAEYLYKAVGGEKESVHLEEWPEESVRRKAQSEKIVEEMQEVRKIVSQALEARAKANIKVRQPLQKLKTKSEKLKDSTRELFKLIEEEINVKEVVFDPTLSTEVELDTTVTPELKDEGQFRELVRFVQEMRKTSGLQAGEIVVLSVGVVGASRRFVEQHEQELSRVCSLRNIVIADSVESAPASSAGAEPFQADEISLTLLLQKA